MNRFFAALATAACLLGLSYTASADTLKFVSDGGVSSGGVDIYPYNFQINGSSATTTLMCIDYNREISFGESWQVTTSSLPLDSSTLSKEFRADAWLFSQFGKGTYSNSDIQFAAWSILDPTDVAKNSAFDATAQNLAAIALKDAVDPTLLSSGFFSNFTLYQPTSNQTGWTNGIPQEFIGAAQTPEPSSLLLMGSGLASFASVVRRRMRS